jgi:ribose 5-phosphate isomerase B
LKIAIGCDHGGYGVKGDIVELLEVLGHQVFDHGCDSGQSVDYPDYAEKVCKDVAGSAADRGILICGTGIGMSMAANRSPSIRAALCHELFTAAMSREHNDANVLCLGARVVGPGLIREIVRTWMSTEFAGGRHQSRIAMFSAPD